MGPTIGLKRKILPLMGIGILQPSYLLRYSGKALQILSH
jgi:hypothetical protein